MLDIDTAIKHCLEVAEEHTKYNSFGGFESCDECAEEHRQLAEWLQELKEAKRLLKLAVEDIHDVLSSQIKITNYTLCEKCKHYLNCNCKKICEAGCDLKQWRYTDEALKLIRGSENE